METHYCPELTSLNAGLEKLRPLLSSDHFQLNHGNDGISSGGSFAVAFFRRGILEISLIVRNKTELGCPNYSEGNGYAGHNDLISALGHEGREQLVAGGGTSYVAKGGGDPFDALRSDLEQFVLPPFRASENGFNIALAQAVQKFHKKLGF
jgi:hypothetical protein